MLTLRSRIFILISIVVLIILAIVIFLLVMAKKPSLIFGTKTPTTTENYNTADGNTPVGIGTPAAVTDFSQIKVKVQGTEDAEKNAARQTARIFIERYNSFSNESSWQNVRDVENLATTDLWKVISKPMEKNSGLSTNSLVVVTGVASLNLTEWSASAAKVAVMANRTETRSGVETKLVKNYNVVLVKTGDNWLVDDFKEVK